ncbi:MAG: cadherin-like domain-containing protein [Hormoscilla sp. GM102CHS1]|nr:cadherin-like domain-containing protein [Hormoscilla sp. GM102CHS1]
MAQKPSGSFCTSPLAEYAILNIAPYLFNMLVDRIILKNWRNFPAVDVSLGSLVFLVGPNACGKSNFLDVFRFLHDLAKPGGGLQRAISTRGGLSQIRCLSAPPATFSSSPDIEIEIHLAPAPYQKQIWKYAIGIRQHQGDDRQPYVSYDSDENNAVLKITRFSLNSSQGGTITRDGNSLHYTPADGFRGEDSFDYTMDDGNGGTDSATVTITVPNAAPEAKNDDFIVLRGYIYTLNVLANDTDFNSDVLEIVGWDDLSRRSDKGNVGEASEGIWYEPPSDPDVSSDSFRYTVSDSNGGTSSAVVTIVIEDVGGRVG